MSKKGHNISDSQHNCKLSLKKLVAHVCAKIMPKIARITRQTCDVRISQEAQNCSRTQGSLRSIKPAEDALACSNPGKLPPELRVMIYALAISHNSCIGSVTRSSIQGFNCRGFEILFTCRQIYIEASPVLLDLTNFGKKFSPEEALYLFNSFQPWQRKVVSMDIQLPSETCQIDLRFLRTRYDWHNHCLQEEEARLSSLLDTIVANELAIREIELVAMVETPRWLHIPEGSFISHHSWSTFADSIGANFRDEELSEIFASRVRIACPGPNSFNIPSSGMARHYRTIHVPNIIAQEEAAASLAPATFKRVVSTFGMPTQAEERTIRANRANRETVQQKSPNPRKSCLRKSTAAETTSNSLQDPGIHATRRTIDQVTMENTKENAKIQAVDDLSQVAEYQTMLRPKVAEKVRFTIDSLLPQDKRLPIPTFPVAKRQGIKIIIPIYCTEYPKGFTNGSFFIRYLDKLAFLEQFKDDYCFE